MSELKAHKAYNRWLDEEMPTPNDDLICNEVYLKSEADKYINLLKDKANYNKYKRCLAMALWCNACLYQFPSFGTPSKKEKWWSKWNDKWLAIAEKLKEAK